jgi:hypothetical protein
MALSKIDVANMLTGATPVANGGTALTSGFVNGLTEVDQWRLTTSFSGNADPIASNWERVDTDSDGVAVGTGMSESSGVFTFPSTGIYLIRLTGVGHGLAHSQRLQWIIDVTTDNSSYDDAATHLEHLRYYGSSLDTWTSGACEHILDVTNTTNVKVRFGFGAGQGGEECIGDSGKTYTGVSFTKIGDT